MGFDAGLERRELWTGRRAAGHNFWCSVIFRSGARAHPAANRGHCSESQRAALSALAIGIVLLGASPLARADKLSFDERMEIERGLNAEFATLKISLPKAKRPLVFHSDGTYDKSAWENTMRENGPSARLGDEVQITRVEIETNKILLEINGGTKSGHWYDHVQVGMGGNNSPINTNQNGQRANGSHLAIVFPGSVPSLKSSDIRQMLSPIFDFEKHSASEQYMDKLPEPIKKAIKEQRAIEGMDKDQVLLALGKPRNKSRETNKDGDEIEDWIYGEPPGKVTFVTFTEGKVVKIQESYANIGGRTSPPLAPPR